MDEAGPPRLRTRVNGRVRTIEQLLEVHGVNRKEWMIDNPEIKSWEGFIKNSDGEIEVETLHSVGADLVPIHPVTIEPIIRPIKITAKKLPKTRVRIRHGVKTALWIFDPHGGFIRQRNGELITLHDRRVLSIALQIAIDLRPDIIGWGGDILDVATWSDKFTASPEFYWTTQPALVEMSWWMHQFDRRVAPEENVVIPGNHDERINKAILNHLRVAYQLKPANEMELPAPLSLERLLGLNDNFTIVDNYPDGEYYLSDSLKVIHGNTTSSTPGGTVGKVVKQHDVSVMMGHIHRRESASRTIWRRGDRREIVEAHCPGCACRVDGVVPGTKKRQQWQQGIGLAIYDDQFAQIIHIPVNEGRAIHNGAMYTAQDHMEEMMNDTNWIELFGNNV